MKTKTQFVCQSCGHASAKWLGKCPACQEWNTLVEERAQPRDAGTTPARTAPSAVRFSDAVKTVSASGEPLDAMKRHKVGIGELDRVLGGGLVADGFVLLGGDPGVGKSTLLLQLAGQLAHQGIRVLYVSGEESVGQVAARATRLGVKPTEHLVLASETNLESVFLLCEQHAPSALVVDSLQTISTGILDSAPGSVAQVREVASRLMQYAKSSEKAVLLVGHVTKDGAIAGPKVVEHLVDTVLYFEGDAGRNVRLLRAVKNRFGSSMELGVFEMRGSGLMEVTNPSALFLSERAESGSGTALTATLEGTRPLLLEVQALVVRSPLAMPRRTSVGLDQTRISMIAAVLEKHAGLELAGQDIFFNVAGGMKLADPACDLACAAAIGSSARGQVLARDLLFLGELGLTGEVRRVAQIELRAREAKRLGMKAIACPASQAKELTGDLKGIEIIPIARAGELSARVG